MKIIAHGKKPVHKPAVYRGKCPYCGCVFEFNDNEVAERERIIDGMLKLGGMWTVKCPECGSDLCFHPDELRISDSVDMFSFPIAIEKMRRYIPVTRQAWEKENTYVYLLADAFFIKEGQVVSPWEPKSHDILAEDWIEVKQK